MEHVIDAQGKSLGRVASLVAATLRGKTSPAYAPHKIPVGSSVKVVHASGVKLTGQKMATKTYDRYSGHPGGLRTLSVGNLSAQHGYKEIMKQAVHRMLPKNKLRPLLMKQLTIEE